MEFQLRIDENSKTPQQITQRERTYEAARALTRAGFDVEVREFFTGSAKKADAAAVVIKQGD